MPAAEERKRGTARLESDEDRGKLGASREDFRNLRRPEMMQEEIGDDDVRRFRDREIVEHVLGDVVLAPTEA